MTIETPNRWQALRHEFRMHWNEESSSVGVVIGCSGGADSVALTRLIDFAHRFSDPEFEEPDACSNLPEHSVATIRSAPVVIAHFNHGLRGKESEGDEMLVRELAVLLNRPVVVGGPEEEVVDRTDESTLRDQRRRFFVDVARRHGCRYIAVAHTADDQAETVLHHLLRGTGPSGLAGMKRVSSIGGDFVLRRPLLSTRREDIRNALVAISQPWREDASNQDSRYTRNWIRNQVMPMLRDRITSVDNSLIRLAQNQTMTQDLLSNLATQWLDAFTRVRSVSNGRRAVCIRKPWGSPLPSEWPHESTLAQDSAVVLYACQSLFDRERIPRGAMDQTNWIRLTEWILAKSSEGNDRFSLGHLPGHIEVFSGSEDLELIVPAIS